MYRCVNLRVFNYKRQSLQCLKQVFGKVIVREATLPRTKENTRINKIFFLFCVVKELSELLIIKVFYTKYFHCVHFYCLLKILNKITKTIVTEHSKIHNVVFSHTPKILILYSNEIVMMTFVTVHYLKVK